MNKTQQGAPPETLRLQLSVLQEIAKLLDRPLDPPHTVRGILRLLSQMLGLNCGRVLAPNKEGQVLEVRYSYGLTHARLRKGAFSVGYDEGVTGFVMRTGSTGLVPDIDREPLYLQRITERPDDDASRIAFIAVPILESGRPVGVLSVQKEGGHETPFEADITTLKVAASAIGQVMRIGEFIRQETKHLLSENQSLRNSVTMEGMLQKSLAHGIIGSTEALLDAVKQCIQVAPSDAPVMLLGESGTGKEKFARMIHQQTDRSERPFICINCAAIPPDLLESELFGHEKGSFTGASGRKKGKVQQADGGTLFLDEIGDMPLQLQSKLLRVLQEHQVDPIGASRPIPVNFRLITATHEDMQEHVNAGGFRLDLFYRINVVPVYLPPLRARRGDIRPLALHFLNELNHRYQRNIALHPEALSAMERYGWPGNIRQLQNVIERAVLMAESDLIQQSQIQQILTEQASVRLPQGTTGPLQTADALSDKSAPNTMGEVGRYQWVRQEDAERILDALYRCGGNQSCAARMLNLSVRQLRYRVEKLGLEVPRR
ncbi:sigma-54-dependent Fis family transcriptional regulator [Thioalkalivibrio sp. AKL12]|uniref:sigma-54-dependent Fis family transcriptional regulator n=1 Tax=Thioalkalivibrio sp. AKL12 TaxID=1158159 RepID=UPI000379C9DB|nr:sigma-54-dependent Fis family transcriptional regulator [Thioalkalivibrio sp. AKL12]